MIDFFAGAQRSYLSHLWPLWYALPPEERGTFWAVGLAAVEVQSETHHFKLGTPGNFGPPTVVAGSLDAARVDPRRPLIYVEHGIGQRYLSDQRGQERSALKRCALHITPRLTGEAKNQVAVGCPKLDPFKERPHGDTIAVTFHWPFRGIPEADWAFPEFSGAIAKLAQGNQVIGHGHPRVFPKLKRFWEANGIEPVESLEEVFQRSRLLIGDNSSALFEFAALDRPVVVLNSKRYRRKVNHGGRFWEFATVGIQVDRPDALEDVVSQALKDHPSIAEERRRIVEEVYAVAKGGAAIAAERMIAMSKEWEMGNPKAPKYSRVRVEPPADGPEFPASRLRRIGAPGSMIQQARIRFDGLEGIEKEASAAHLAAMPDSELRSEVENFSQDRDPMPKVAEVSIPVVLNWVGESKSRARKALNAERNREDRNEGRGRTTLIGKLQHVINA